MAEIFITGSSDGLGQLAAKQLIDEGHQVVVHARNESRAEDTKKEVENADEILIGDLSSVEETKALADKANELGKFDVVIHNAGIMNERSKRIFTVNTLAPYILTCLMKKPERLIYMSSGMHLQGNPDLDDFDIDKVSYGDSKLHLVMLAMAVDRLWSNVYSNAVNPGWVPTKMGGSNAPDSLEKGYETQVWLATSDADKAKVSGKYFFHKKPQDFLSEAADEDRQKQLLEICQKHSGVSFP